MSFYLNTLKSLAVYLLQMTAEGKYRFWARCTRYTGVDPYRDVPSGPTPVSGVPGKMGEEGEGEGWGGGG